jgi:hypothetical protein
MFGTFCFLWRNQPAKIAALTMLLPSLGVTMFMDGIHKHHWMSTRKSAGGPPPSPFSC